MVGGGGGWWWVLVVGGGVKSFSCKPKLRLGVHTTASKFDLKYPRTSNCNFSVTVTVTLTRRASPRGASAPKNRKQFNGV